MNYGNNSCRPSFSSFRADIKPSANSSFKYEYYVTIMRISHRLCTAYSKFWIFGITVYRQLICLFLSSKCWLRQWVRLAILFRLRHANRSEDTLVGKFNYKYERVSSIDPLCSLSIITTLQSSLRLSLLQSQTIFNLQYAIHQALSRYHCLAGFGCRRDFLPDWR